MYLDSTVLSEFQPFSHIEAERLPLPEVIWGGSLVDEVDVEED
jgi:hypothetical protein